MTMKLFSQRKGIKPVKSVIQVDSIDDELRNGLWDALIFHYWDQMEEHNYISSCYNIDILFKKLWHNYFKRPIDTLKNWWDDTYIELRKKFFKCEWYEVYDFIEFIANNYPEDYQNKKFMDFCNYVLERELSAYRFVGEK
jgi:hypothetical protein